MSQQLLVVMWGTDQAPFVNKMLEDLITEEVVKEFKFEKIEGDPGHIKYTIECFEQYGYFKIGYESAKLYKQLRL